MTVRLCMKTYQNHQKKVASKKDKGQLNPNRTLIFQCHTIALLLNQIILIICSIQLNPQKEKFKNVKKDQNIKIPIYLKINRNNVLRIIKKVKEEI